MFFNSITQFLAAVPAILIAITFHEYAHGKMAAILGDPTPENQGRLTLNPLKHLDVFGTLMLFVVGFGWAKPVQVNPFFFQGDRRKGMMYVGLAGPMMNFVLAYLAAIALQLVGPGGYLATFLYILMLINSALGIFNLIPVPPLDGSKILSGLLPQSYSHFFYKLEQYGPIILILLLVTGLAGRIMSPLLYGLVRFFQTLAGLFYF